MQAALDGIEEDDGKTFEPLDMPVSDDEFATEVGGWRREGVNDEFRDSRVMLSDNPVDSDKDDTKPKKKPYVNEEGRTGITFGTNIDKEEE